MKPANDGRRATRDLARLYGSPPGRKGEAPTVEGKGFGGQSGVACRRSPSPKSTTSRLPNNWRGRLPAPATWYALNVPSMTVKDGIGVAPCPLHSDAKRSFRVDLTGTKGVWSCPAWGKGDLVALVMRLHGIGFVEAVRRLVIGGAV